MRVAIIGASGNVGTALLRELRDVPAVTEVRGLASRVPSVGPPPPYDSARWSRVDLGVPGDDEPVVQRLTSTLGGVDAVVLLSWAIQPSHDRGLLRRTNVDGARRTIEAVRRAGAPHLVVASSVGAYSPARDEIPRDEDWPTDGVRSSDYSVDKVAVERLLDEAEATIAGLTVARVRPALVFQRAAGSSIERQFLGPAAPAAVLRHRLPVLPWPRGFRLQAVHADDLALAFRAILLGGHGGAFNVADPGVLRAGEVAGVVGAGRWMEVPPAAVRAAVGAAWLARAVAVSPGWIDLAGSLPLMSTDRARSVLAWQPRWQAVEALADLVDGLATGAGTASPPLRPRRRARRSLVGGQVSRR